MSQNDHQPDAATTPVDPAAAGITPGSADPQSAVKDTLTRKGAGRVVETPEFAAFARRIMRAYGRRIAAGDIDALPDLVALAGEVDAMITQAVAGLRADNYSWSEIGARLNITRQAAQQRFGRSTPTTDEWREMLGTPRAQQAG